MSDGVETTIRRGRNNNPWVQAPKAVIENAAISVEARWLLVYLLGKPDGWIIRVADIQNRTGWGRDKTRKHIKELVEARYLLPEYSRDGGRFAAMRFVVLDEPGQPETLWDDRDGLPVTGKPSTAEPYTANPAHRKNDSYQELKDTKIEERAARKRACRIPKDWQPDMNEARALGFTDDAARWEADKFRDYWSARAGKGAAKLDWLATWRNWLKGAIENGRTKPKATPRHRNALVEAADRLEREAILARGGDPERESFDGMLSRLREDRPRGVHGGDGGTVQPLFTDRPAGRNRPGDGTSFDAQVAADTFGGEGVPPVRGARGIRGAAEERAGRGESRRPARPYTIDHD